MNTNRRLAVALLTGAGIRGETMGKRRACLATCIFAAALFFMSPQGVVGQALSCEDADVMRTQATNPTTLTVVATFVRVNTDAMTITFKNPQGTELTWPLSEESAKSIQGMTAGKLLSVRFPMIDASTSAVAKIGPPADAVFAVALAAPCLCTGGGGGIAVPMCTGTCRGDCPAGTRCTDVHVVYGFSCGCGQ